METKRPVDEAKGGARSSSRFASGQKPREKGTPQKWVQCTLCKKWRQVPFHLNDSDLGDRWDCTENIWEPMYASCNVPQALSDEQIDAILEPAQEEDQGEMQGVAQSSQEIQSQEPSPSHRWTVSEGAVNEGGCRYRGKGADNSQAVHEGRHGQESNEFSCEDAELSDVAEAMLKLGGDTACHSQNDRSSTRSTACSLVPGRVVWGKVEGHDWWPAKVVRRRSVPSEVGPPPGGAGEVMYYTPVVFFTPKGIPKEVELSMDSEEFPIVVCQRACGLMEEDEAEYAWLSADNIRLFCLGDTSGKKDGSHVEDEQLQRCIVAAEHDLATSEALTQHWKDSDDSDGGWCCAADFHRNRHQKHKKASRRKSKRLEDGGSDVESGQDEGPELMPYGTFRLAPKIAVEHIYAWRRPLTREEKAKEIEKENEENAMNLKKLLFLAEALRNNEHLSVAIFDMFELQHRRSELQTERSMSILDDSNLMQQEKEAVSTLLGLGPLSEIGEPVLASLDEAEFFVKYANRSHLHNEWVKESTLMAFAKRKLTQFKRRYSDEPIDMFKKEWAKPERIISRRKCRTGPGWELLIKWMDLGYEFCTWEAENARILSRPETVLLYIDLWRRQGNAVQKRTKRSVEIFHETKTHICGTYKPLEGTPPWLRNGQLHPHQLEVLNWLRSMWLPTKGGVLVGKTGYGITAAVASFLQCLKEEIKCVNPFLLVTPAGRFPRWSRESDFWSRGQLHCVQYHGSTSARPVCLEHEIWQYMECMDGRFPSRETKKIPKPDVVMVGSDIFCMELDNLREVSWDVAILDTRWIAKGNVTRLAAAMAQTKCPHFIITNDLPTSELGLMNTLKLIDAKQATLMESHGAPEEADKEEHMIEQLQSLMKKRIFEMGAPVRQFPLQLYREVLIPLEFKPEQKDQYKDALVRYFDLLKDESTHRVSVQNVGTLKHIAEELALICQHPALADDNQDADHVGQLSHQSGKFEALEVLLREMMESNLCALLLTQSQKTQAVFWRLIVEHFGSESVELISPSDSTLVRHRTILRFASGDGNFLLTTCDACGLGTALSKIHCVILLESAINANDDLVALSQAYQLGQSPELPVLRLFLAGTVEERMLQIVKKSESLILSPLSKSTSYDTKLFEDVLIWGTRSLFVKATELGRDPLHQSEAQRSIPCRLDSAKAKTLLHGMFEKRDSTEGRFEPALPSVRWKLHSRSDIQQSQDVPEVMEFVDHMHDTGLLASYWEQLLRHDWNEKKQREEKHERTKKSYLPHGDRCRGGVFRLAAQRSGPQDCEMEKEASDPEDHSHHGAKDTTKRKAGHRRKRFSHENESMTGNKGQKKHRSQRADSLVVAIPEEDPNDENKWTRDILLSCKAHQDVLTQILADPNTAEGKAAHEAFHRIDVIATELSLPVNIVMMAKQVAEILLTMKDDQDCGSFFHDYTLLTIVAFAAFLGGFSLGEGFGLKALATKYQQDAETMEKLFNYVTKLMLDYKQMLIKINQLLRAKVHPVDVKKSPAKPDGMLQMTESSHVLHRDLDAFLRGLSGTLSPETKREKEADIKRLAAEIVDDRPPGAPIKGHSPSQWFPSLQASESDALAKRARLCDAEMYVVEKLHESKVRSIEKGFHTFQERVREYGVKAIESVSHETMVAKTQVEGKKHQLKKELQSLTQTRAEHAGTAAYGVLLAKFQQTQQWQQTQEQQALQGSQSSAMRVPNFLETAGRIDQGREDHMPSSLAEAEYLHRVAPQRPAPLPMDQLLLTISASTAGPAFHKAQEISPPTERRNLLSKTAHAVPRVVQYTVPSHPLHLSKTSRNSFHNVKLPIVGHHRPAPEDPASLQRPFGFSANLGQSQHSVYVSNVLSLQQAAQSMSISLQSSPAMLSNFVPGLTNLCMLQPRIPHPPAALPSHAPPQRSEAEMASPAVHSQLQLPHNISCLWSPAPRTAHPPAEETGFGQGRPKTYPLVTAHQADWLSKAVEHASTSPTEPVFEDQRGGVLQRTSSMPGSKATITTGIGRAVPPPPELSSKQSVFGGGSHGLPELQRMCSTRSLPETGPNVPPPGQSVLRTAGGSLDETVLAALQQQMAGSHPSSLLPRSESKCAMHESVMSPAQVGLWAPDSGLVDADSSVHVPSQSIVVPDRSPQFTPPCQDTASVLEGHGPGAVEWNEAKAVETVGHTAEIQAVKLDQEMRPVSDAVAVTETKVPTSEPAE